MKITNFHEVYSETMFFTNFFLQAGKTDQFDLLADNHHHLHLHLPLLHHHSQRHLTQLHAFQLPLRRLRLNHHLTKLNTTRRKVRNHLNEL